MTALAVSSIGSAVFQLLMIKLAEFVIGPFRETFALVLSLIFAGITLGATLVGRFRFRFKGLMVANCLSLLWIIIGFRIAVEFYARWYEAAAVSHVGSVGLKLGFLATIMLFPAATFGATIPALIREQSNPAKESGKLLCISSMGNVAGFLLMVLFLHPRFDYGLIILSVLGLSVLSLIVYEPRISLMTALGVGIALSGFNFHGKFWQEDLLYLGHTSFHSSEELREAVEDFEFPQRFRGPQDVFSITWSDGSPHFFVNGYISMVLDSPWEPMVGAFASVMAPRVDRALVLGLGSGATASVVGLIFDQTDAVEINGVVLENLYRMRAYNFDIENNPRVRIIHDDAIHFAKTSDEKYSLIINTVTTPLYFSSSKLYTKDFIDRIGSRLKHDGVYVTWVDSRVGSEGVNIILKTLGASFEHCAIGFIRSSYFLLFCSSEPLQPTQAGIVAQNPILGPHFVREFEIRPEWLAYGLLSTRALELIGSQEVPLNTLNYPALEFEMTRLRERGYTDFQDRLTDQMNLADLKRTLSGNLTWDPVSLLLHTEDVLGDSRFTRRWKELVGAEIDDLEERLASSEISVEEEFLEVVGSADLYHKLGFHFMENSRYRKAIAYFEKALELDTQRDNAYFNIGACYEYLRDYPLAIEFYKLEREVDPDDTDVPYRLGRVYVKVGHHQEAVRELDKAVERLDSASVQYYRGRAFEGLGATSRALESYREALSLEANHEEAWKALDRLGGAEE